MSEDPTRPTAAMLKKWYENPKDPHHHDDALHMLAKFLIQGIRARGIFKDGSDVGYFQGKPEEAEYKYDLTGAKRVYESFKYCVYNKIFGDIKHEDLTFDIVHKDIVYPKDKEKLENMIKQMVKFYKNGPNTDEPNTDKSIIYPSMSKSFIPLVDPSCPDTPTEPFTFTENAKRELNRRLRFGPLKDSNEKDAQRIWTNDWHAIFTAIFGRPSFGSRNDSTSVIINKPVGTITFPYSGGKSTRRARTKKARRAKRHTRRAARREYRAR
jgi:hypothetical protein